jgi:PAS domain S-box-containing protein
LETRVEERTKDLEEEKALSESIINSLPGIFYLFDNTGEFKRWNHNFEVVSEYSSTEITEAQPTDFFVGDEKELVKERIQEVFVNGYADVEAQFISKSGNVVPYFLTGICIELDGQQHLIGTGFDITQRVRAELALSQKAAELERSNEELEQFAYIASHDLQAPLRKIIAFSDRLVKKYMDILDARGQEYLTRMKEAAQRGQGMINDLLSLSRVTTQGKTFQRTDLNQVLQDVLSDLEVQIERSCGQVEVGALPVLYADPTQMHQLFQNLVGNALKFHKPGIPPSVKVTTLAGDSHQIRIQVADNGIGFDSDQSEKIFLPFQRLHGQSEYEGSGIGLSICRKIVERHGGTIYATSQLGKGASFIVNLPIQQVITAENTI